MPYENIQDMSFHSVKNIWKSLHNSPESRKILSPEILDSWERSSQYDVYPFKKSNEHFVSAAEFKRAVDNSRHLIKCALPVMKSLLEFMAGTGFIAGLTDSNLVTLKVLGDNESLNWAKKAQLVEGSIWAEELIGTNTGALALSLVKPISVCAYEHYCLFSIVSAASCCPIIDKGHVVGSIAMVAPYDRISNHTLGMVVAATQHIQSTMALERISKYQRVVMNSMSDGIMAVDIDGDITFMNKKCSRMLGIRYSSVISTNIYELFGKDPENAYFINIITQGRTVTDEFILLRIGKTSLQCNITCTPLYTHDSQEEGRVVIIRESERINHIVGKWIGNSARMTFDNILGINAKFCEVISNAKAASSSNSNVLLLGESGTGKDIIAQAMHNESPRSNHPFVAINCAALPRELIASELFGYEDGAFTGAKKGGNIGKFELANHGTIFLDEIGDMPMDLQATLLRVLEDKSVTRLGGSKLVPVNVRIIAATNKNLEEEIALNRFRRDLFYRLGVIRLSIPPLRERPEDILVLAQYFLETVCQRYNKPLKKLSSDVIKVFLNHDWPGNVRELQNVLEGAVQLAKNAEITYDLVENYLSNTKLEPIIAKSSDTTTPLSLADIEKNVIEEYLHKDYTKKEIAQMLGISRRTLYRRLKKYDFI